MAKVRQQPDGCWHWTAAVIKAVGYGRFGFGDTVDYAHRASWRIFRGPIPVGALVCHKCDVRRCVNPSHLFIGSHSDNMKDASKKGRVKLPTQTYASDQTHQVSKLTDEQVRTIRAAPNGYGVRTKLSREFGVHPHTIWDARTGRTFKDVPWA